MKYAIITGVTKGLGESAARLFLESGIHVIGISRRSNHRLRKLSEENHVNYQHLSCDLGDLQQLERTAKEIMDYLEQEDSTSIYLVNNAAVLDPIGQATTLPNAELKNHVTVNTIAPMILTNTLLQWAIEQDIHFIGAAITSGAAEKTHYGWSAYCSTKASINMYTKTVALEQDERETGNKLIAFSPGVMDTEMQEKIRASSPEAFVEVDTFRNYKQQNLLKETDAVGSVLVDILMDESNIVNGKVYNVTDYL